MRKRKGIAIIAITCMAMTFISLPSLGQAENITTIILEEKQDRLGEITDSGYVPVEKIILNQKDLEAGRQRQSTHGTAIPSSYDAREEGLLSEIRSQGQLGNCWAYAVMGASEANIRKKGYEREPDLSEYHLSYSIYNKTLDPMGLTIGDICRVKEMDNSIYSWGGNDYLAVSTLSRWQGVLEEEDAPLTDLFLANKNKIPAILPEEILNKDSYHLQNTEYIYITESNRDLIKRKIMEYGAGTISFYTEEGAGYNTFSNTGYNDYTAYYCNDKTKRVNHEVMVVGWDDNYEVSNFNASCRPSNPGAWLVRNSWGDCNDMNGYFWLSYEDTMLNLEYNEEAEIAFFDIEKNDKYEHNYQYDGGIPFGYIRGCKSVANVFTAQNNEKLQAVSFYTQERNVNYEINLYKVEEASKPTTGTKLGEVITGKCEERGYHTIDFSVAGIDDVILQKGDNFSIVLSLSDSSGASSYFTYDTKMGYSELEETLTGGTNQSLLFNGAEWVDFAQMNDSNGNKHESNFCIKAFTTDRQVEMTTASAVPTNTAAATSTPTSSSIVIPTPISSPTVIPTEPVKPTIEVTPTEPVKPTTEVIPTASSTAATPEKATPTADTDVANVSTPTMTGQPIVKKLSFSPKTKKVKVGKKISLKKYLKITKKRSGTPKLKYEFTKKKYKKYASLTAKGVLKAKKKGRKKTIYVRVKALDGSGKVAKIKIKIS